MKSLSHVRLFATPWTVACQAYPSMEFSRQEYWSGLPFPSPGDLAHQGSNLGLPHCRQTLCCLSHQESCFLTCIQISQEAGKVVWYSHLLKNFPQFVVIYTVKAFGIINKAEVDFFWNSLAFLMIQWILAISSLFPLSFLNPA